MSSSEKKVTLELTAKEFRQLIFLGHLGAFFYQTTRDAKDTGVSSGYNVLHKTAQAGIASGVNVLGEDDRLAQAIDMAILEEVITHNRHVMDNQEFWEKFEIMGGS
jgi:hypothetical protein